jgi:hypothetical protein
MVCLQPPQPVTNNPDLQAAQCTDHPWDAQLYTQIILFVTLLSSMTRNLSFVVTLLILPLTHPWRQLTARAEKAKINMPSQALSAFLTHSHPLTHSVLLFPT